MQETSTKLFDLTGKVVIITGGAGMLGEQHGCAVASCGAIPVILDLSEERATATAENIAKKYGVGSIGYSVDITSEQAVKTCAEEVKKRFGKIDVLINNAANNPKVDNSGKVEKSSRLEFFDLEIWHQDLAVGLTGAFLCAKYFGSMISRNPDGGSIINISSDLGVIAPNQSLYKEEGLPDEQQPVKPVTYSVVKTGLIGLSRYLATYWADKNVRSNALCPGGVFNHQGEGFLKKVEPMIPMGRMAKKDEYQGAIIFLSSNASSYMNGAVLSIDGGRTAW
jgi:NAD(P)-dependent dehydrogenase (short-subunit alcohol dehydrogenase family)